MKKDVSREFPDHRAVPAREPDFTAGKADNAFEQGAQGNQPPAFSYSMDQFREDFAANNVPLPRLRLVKSPEVKP